MSSSGVSADATTSSVARSTATTLPSYPSTCSTRPDMAPTLPASLVDIGPDTRRCPSRARPSAKETLPARSSPNLPEAPCPGRTRRPEAGRGKGAKRGGRGFRRVSRLGRRRTSAGPAESGRDLGEHGPSAPMEALLMKSLRTPQASFTRQRSEVRVLYRPRLLSKSPHFARVLPGRGKGLRDEMNVPWAASGHSSAVAESRGGRDRRYGWARWGGVLRRRCYLVTSLARPSSSAGSVNGLGTTCGASISGSSLFLGGPRWF